MKVIPSIKLYQNKERRGRARKREREVRQELEATFVGMDMGVDKAWENEFAFKINDLS